MNFYGEFSPVVKYGVPYKRGTGAYYDWIDEEIDRIKNGYQVGGKSITGRFYFYLNFFKLLHTDEQAKVKYEILISPYLADVKKEMYDIIDECEISEEDLVVVKGRDKGLSYDFASIALRETQFFPNTGVCGIFPGGESPALKNFKAKYDEGWTSLLADMRHVAGLSDSKQYYKYGREVTLEDGTKEERGMKSSLTLLKAVNPNVAKSGRYKIMLLDEIGEMPILTDLITTNAANMRKGGFKFGMTLAAGTTNSFSREAYAQVRDLYFNCRDYKFRKFPIVAQRAYWGFVNYETGVSDEEGAKAHILAERKALEERNDEEGRKKLTIVKQNYPTSEKEMFIVTTQSPFNSEKCAGQILNILTNNEIKKQIQRGNLFMGKNEKGETIVDFRITPLGRWLVWKHPTKDLLVPDVGAVDSYRLANVQESDSKGAIIGYRGFNGVGKVGNCPTFIYHYRHADKDDFFKDCLMSAMYWNMKLLVEYADEDIFKWFTVTGNLRWLKEMPKVVQSPWSKGTYRFGVKPTEHSIAVSLEYAVREFNQHYENIVFEELLDELPIFGLQNTDLADAYRWVVLHAIDNIKMLPEHRKEKERPFMPYIATDAAGGTIVINTREKETLYMRTGGYGIEQAYRQP